MDDAPGTARPSVRWIGHSTVLVSLDGVRLLTDPMLRVLVTHLRRRVPVHPEATRGIDAVLLSHAHHDHLDPGSLQKLGRKTPLVVPRGLGSFLRRQGFRDVHELAVGEGLQIGAVRVEATFAAHDGSRPPYPARAPAVGYALLGSRRVYFAGDTDLCESMWTLGDIDLALIPVWGWGPTLGRGLHLDPLKAAESLRRIRPRAAVPIHWGTYWPHAMGRVFPERLVEPPAAFAEYASELAPDVRTLPTAVGDAVSFTT